MTSIRLRATPSVLLSALLALGAAPVQAATLEPVTTDFVDGAFLEMRDRSWNGRLTFPGVYCVDFLTPERAHSRTTGLINNNAVAVARVEYADARLAAFVVASTMTAGLDNAAEYQQQLERARDNSSKLGGLMQYETRDSALGPVIAFHLRNVVHEHEHGFFPVELEFYDAAGTITWGETRLFSRGPDRLEVAVLVVVDKDATPELEQQTRAMAAAHADQLLDSLQQCTGPLPLRTP